MKPQKLFLFIFLIANIILNSCKESTTEPTATKAEERGEIISITPLATFSASQINLLVDFYNIPINQTLTYSVDAVKIVYISEDIFGNNIELSGALMIPQNGDDLPLFSLNHGTVTGRNEVASVNPLNSVEGITGIISASIGYLTCVPDYPGFGVSNLLHPYIHAKSLSIAVIDFIRAAKNYADQQSILLNGKLFLSGYSEGGYVTLASQKEIEADYSGEFSITAVAPMAGPYDLLGTARALLQQTTYDWPAYLAFLITAYNDLYSWNRLSDIFNAPYAAMIPGLFDGSKSFSEVNNQLPTTISDWINPAFINGFINGSETEVIAALKENTLLNWTPLAPIRFFHGDSDDSVPYQNALTALDSLIANGGTNIDLVTIPGGDHASSGIPAILGMLDYFEPFRITSKVHITNIFYKREMQN